ncbi:MAG: glycosyltransferase family 4 protein [Treponema sp.]|nr:glycosyltransferase family 4 protein [Treponema sp.]
MACLKILLTKIIPIPALSTLKVFFHEGISGISYKIRNKFLPARNIINPISTVGELVEIIGSNKKNTIVGTDELILAEEQKKELVGLVTQDMELTGAPVALLYFAQALKRQGMHPVIISPRKGPLVAEASKDGITTIIYRSIYDSYLIKRISNLFSLIIVNTIVGGAIIGLLSGLEKNIIWWIHEAAELYKNAYYIKRIPKSVAGNIHIYCVNDYAEKALKKYRPDFETRQLFYYIPDFAQNAIGSNYKICHDKSKTVFSIVGVLQDRKSQDVLCEAIELLPESTRSKCVFYFIGKRDSRRIWSRLQILCEKFPDSVRYIEQMQRNELFAFYNSMDCLISTSIDDPLPIVITEAMVLSKAIICSEGCGTASLLRQHNGGLVYAGISELVNCIGKVADSGMEISGLGANARRIYDKYFSRNVFDANVAALYKSYKTVKSINVSHGE